MQDGVNLPEYHLAFVFAKWHNAPLVNAVLSVGDDLVHVYLVDVSQSFATWTGSLWRVERERVGSRVGIGDASGRTHQSFREMLGLACLEVHNHQQTLALSHGYLDGFLQSLVGSLLDC